MIGAHLIRHNNSITRPAFRAAIQTNDRGDFPACPEEVRIEVTARCRNNQEARGAERAKFDEIGSFFGRIVVGVAEDNAVRVLEGDIFGSPHYSRKEGIRDIRDNHPQYFRAIQAQPSCKGAGLKSKTANRLRAHESGALGGPALCRSLREIPCRWKLAARSAICRIVTLALILDHSSVYVSQAPIAVFLRRSCGILFYSDCASCTRRKPSAPGAIHARATSSTVCRARAICTLAENTRLIPAAGSSCRRAGFRRACGRP